MLHVMALCDLVQCLTDRVGHFMYTAILCEIVRNLNSRRKPTKKSINPIFYFIFAVVIIQILKGNFETSFLCLLFLLYGQYRVSKLQHRWKAKKIVAFTLKVPLPAFAQYKLEIYFHVVRNSKQVILGTTI